ncbi:MAG: DUF4249 domain-containing protein [Flammeovirgaceae bacterium]|nr:DUF4249 domain-containing protein [Flammeovirgaceae bacterium]
MLNSISNWLINLFLRLGFLLLISSCEEVVTPDLITADPVIVIDSWVTNMPGNNYIKLTQTAAFNSPEATPRVSNAIIFLTDNFNRRVRFIEREQGSYLPENDDFTGKPGGIYKLSVRIGETEFLANSKMSNVAEIDSLTYNFREDEPLFEDGYYLTAYFQDPPSQKNYYYWEVLLNEEIINNKEINISDDANVNGQYLNFELPFFIDKAFADSSDRVQVNIFSLTEEAYKYYQGLDILTKSGSPAQAVPENPPTNIQNGALGFFNVSAMDSSKVTLME